MMTLTSLLFVAFSITWVGVPPEAQDCRDWHVCRQLALDAAAREDYNAFHDLAWRTLQAGPKNDPALMTMLARAQSLSGRPHDALVMLQRLASMGVVTDAATSDDFARVRALPTWAEFEAKINGLPAPDKAAATPPAGAATARPEVPNVTAAKGDTSKVDAAKAGAGPGKVDARKDPKTEEPPKADPTTVEPPKIETSKVEPTAAAKPKGSRAASAPLVFSASGLAAVGLGYDAVSGRFIVADGKDRRLLVVGERSGRLASLAGVDAGFDEVSAFEIDAAEGDLWVVSTSSRSRSSTLHKLQLISGRVLASIPLPTDEGYGRFTDVAVTPQNILVLDGEGRRVYRVAKKGRTLELVARLAAPGGASLAPAADGLAYAAYDRGLLRVDLTTRAMTVVEPPQQTSLEALRWIRWYRGSLVAIQGDAAGPYRLLRLRLDESGRRVRTVDVLNESLALAGPTSATLAGSVLYYLSPVGASGSDQVEIKKLTLK